MPQALGLLDPRGGFPTQGGSKWRAEGPGNGTTRFGFTKLAKSLCKMDLIMGVQSIRESGRVNESMVDPFWEVMGHSREFALQEICTGVLSHGRGGSLDCPIDDGIH